ncbi:MAG: methyltransferase domain-containing protein [Nitrospirota bacterium]|nr:methyltransferase domain-containing protein [Nitrospirota bacterium]
MDEQKMKIALKETFDTVSAGYDGSSLRFFPRSAENMAALLDLKGDEHILDVACGTGHASLAVAKKLLKGRVTAVDFSAGMLDQARRKADALGIGNIEFLEGDMQKLGFSNRPFDAAVCAFGIFFVQDMETQLSHIASQVRPGGRVMISNFQESYFHPLKDLFMDRLAAYGVQSPPQAWKRIAHEDGCRQLFETAGLKDISVEKRNVGYHLASAEEWWDIVWNAGFRRLVAQLSEQEQERFKDEHLAEVEKLRTQDGIRLDVGVLYTTGTIKR